MSERIVIGFGGNIGSDADITQRFDRARTGLALGSIEVVSAPLFRTAAIGPAQQPFLNTAVAIVAPDLEEHAMMPMLLELERRLGRSRDDEVRWGPRALDLDVLIWGARTINLPVLVAPHPRLAERRFALAPLAALVGEDFVVPGAGPLRELLAGVRSQACDLVAETW